ncbi:ABC transporter ATP-binding protein [Thiomicrospira sp. ALE5]|uniref:ABC transporter ATP-binding protein n=1 Tax=Thiomicrospira sp. ALE5 TaxID=748650 RepID=UPI0008E45B07|nr:ABC transporter ATP-binding protein [Thiomicrospira sp. ALE5]SFR49276.1 HlyD family secretion protein [Thiomicrospira sp. ALE5]
MIKLIKELYSLLTPSQRKRFLVLQVLVVIMAIAEIIGVASIAPFMALVGDMSILERDNLLATLYGASGLDSPQMFVFYSGVAVLGALALASAISIFTTWHLSLFAARVGTQIGDRLYTHYMQQPWLFHAGGSSAQLVKQITTESARVTRSIIFPVLQMNAKIVLAALMSIGLIIYDPIVALAGLLIFAFAYIVLYRLVRVRLQRNSRIISDLSTQRFRLMNEGFGGIKDVLLLGRKQDFIHRFDKTGGKLARSTGVNEAIALVPRYFMELIAFGAMIGLVLYLLVSHQGNLGMVLPILSVYALAGFKLLPAFQQIYGSVARVKGAVSAFDAIKKDLANSQTPVSQASDKPNKMPSHISPKSTITLENITFTYPNKNTPALNSLNLQIKVNQVVGIVGPSGSGKSTAIDMLLGLIQPQQGQLKIDDTIITDQNRRAWQNTIGFVPQSIFLSEGSIAENVAFGIPEKDIDLEQVNKALKLAHLDELVQSLEQGINTKVGERGVQLSGGQRQRIGIARALYHEADVLVFDEATSALDGITEKMIMEAIHDFSGQKTIIMIAHRLKTVQKCDQIYYIDQGRVIDQGNYQQLIERNAQFKRMAAHA